MKPKTYNTPKRKCVVKTRLTEDERKTFEDKCAALSMSQSEYIRQAILQQDNPGYPSDRPQRGNADCRFFPCGAVRKNRQQLKSDCPLSERIRHTLQCPVRRSAGSRFRPCRLKV